MNSTFRFYVRKVICHSMLKSSSSAREARMLKKMIDRSLTKATPGFQQPRVLKKQNPLSAYENEGINRRTIALNKIYMEHIPEMIYGGNFSDYFKGLNIQISKVQLSKDIRFLNIYYITQETDTPEYIINEVLRRIAKELQMRMGDIKFSEKIPWVRFVNDVRLEKEVKLESIFEIMDLGKDSVPTHSKKVITSCTVHKPDDLPVMRQDVLGVDVAKIKQRISADILRFKAINTVRSDEPPEEPEYPKNLIQFKKKEFLKFFKRRRIEELKRLKKERQGLYMHENHDESEGEYENEQEADDFFDYAKYADEFEVEYENENDDEFEAEYENENDDEFEVEYENENDDEFEVEYENENEYEHENENKNKSEV